jgi:hypothetical protein
MIYGFDNGKFYIDFKSCERPHGNMKEESDLRARQLAETGSKFLLGFSGGLDSQSVLHSFHTQGIPLETALLYLPGYNDNEYEQVKFIDKKYGIKSHIVDLDPMAVKNEILEISEKHDIPGKNNILQAKFLSLLPDDYDFIQMVHDPFVYVSPSYNLYYYQGYYLPEINRDRAFNMLERKGKHIFYGDTTEFLLSVIDDEIFRAAFIAAMYYDGNGLDLPDKKLKTFDRWDYYIKPLLYGKYWGDTLTYFPKYQGFENIDYLKGNPKTRKHGIAIPYYEFLNFLNTPGGQIKRFYENVND